MKAIKATSAVLRSGYVGEGHEDTEIKFGSLSMQGMCPWFLNYLLSLFNVMHLENIFDIISVALKCPELCQLVQEDLGQWWCGQKEHWGLEILVQYFEMNQLNSKQPNRRIDINHEET